MLCVRVRRAHMEKDTHRGRGYRQEHGVIEHRAHIEFLENNREIRHIFPRVARERQGVFRKLQVPLYRVIKQPQKRERKRNGVNHEDNANRVERNPFVRSFYTFLSF